jgi:peptidoglycan hydrolase-like protein with peptidoglycan-binding domain
MLVATPSLAGSEDFLSKDDRRLVQQSLSQSGFDTRSVDGVFGKGTRRAIWEWQTFNGYKSTGRLTRAQCAAISGDGASVVIQSQSGDEAAWREARAQSDARAYRSYLRRYPGGIHVRQAKERIDRKRLVAGRAIRERALGLNRAQRREVEELLANAGYYPGSINGKFGPDARNAIRQYRRDRGLGTNAYLDREMLSYLVRDSRGRSHDRQNGEDNTDIAVGVAAGALLLGGIILLSD